MNKKELLFSPDLLKAAEAELYGTVVIPPCPAIVVVLLEEVGKEVVDYAKIVRLVTRDAGMASATLKLANSPVFGIRPRVTSVQQAVLVLGLRNMFKVIYGVALKQSVARDANNMMQRFWERSGYNAATCGFLATKLFGGMTDDAHNFGLFHDAGVAVLLQQQAGYRETLKLANANPEAITQIEMTHHQTTHVRVGALLAKAWHLPDHVVWAIYHHHNYHQLPQPEAREAEDVFRLVAIRVLSEHIVSRFLGFEADPEWEFAKDMVLEYLSLSEEAQVELAAEARSYLEELRASGS